MANAKFTDIFIKNLTPKAKRYDVREGEGFCIRVFPSGEKSFFYVYQLNGHRRRMTLGRYPALSLKEARKEHAKAASLTARRIDPAAKRADEKMQEREAREENRRRPTVAALSDEYIERHAKRFKRTWERDRYLLDKEVVPVLGSVKACDVTRRDVTLLIEGIASRGAPTFANRVLSLVRKLFNFGLQREAVTVNPCNGIQKPANEKARERTLSPDELRALWRALQQRDGDFRATPEVKAALLLVLLTAGRIGEIMAAKWDEFDLAGGWWEIPSARMKNKRPHRVWLTRTALDVLDTLRELSGFSAYVIPSPRVGRDGDPKSMATASVNHAIRRSLKAFMPEDYEPADNRIAFHRLDIAPFTPHDLRRTVATFMGELGIQPHIIGKVLSHSDQTVTGKHYDKFSYDPDRRAALECWESRLLEIVGERRESRVVPLIVNRRGY
ncbi:MAG: tyrosine-type recombinase/integrase [Gammaproteobacteria bacterium]|nr:tyrosine-type recombinase/integrase [Gammaproteobacteria bacterium]MCP5416470.1 tyrosine-type recombinase/integrase [Chromatiaceae bacterium]